MKKYTAFGLKLSVANFVEKGVSGSAEPEPVKFVSGALSVTELLVGKNIFLSIFPIFGGSKI